MKGCGAVERKMTRAEFCYLTGKKEEQKRRLKEVRRIQEKYDTAAMEDERYMRVSRKRSNCI